MPIANFRPQGGIELLNMIGQAHPAFGSDLLDVCLASEDSIIFGCSVGNVGFLKVNQDGSMRVIPATVKNGGPKDALTLSQGRIIANVRGSGTLNFGLIYSDDGGETWIASNVPNTSSLKSFLASDGNGNVVWSRTSGSGFLFNSTAVERFGN